MAWGGSTELSPTDCVYEPLPEMDQEELRRLRATIGFPQEDSVPLRLHSARTVIDLRDGADVDADADDRVSGTDDHVDAAERAGGGVVGLLADVDRKVDQLIELDPAPVFNAFFGEALVSLHGEIEDMHQHIERLQASIDVLTRALLGG
ncbi:MAG: hypothetical protein QOD38_1943 [Acidimicrobiaceae bacterium]